MRKDFHFELLISYQYHLKFKLEVENCKMLYFLHDTKTRLVKVLEKNSMQCLKFILQTDEGGQQ